MKKYSFFLVATLTIFLFDSCNARNEIKSQTKEPNLKEEFSVFTATKNSGKRVVGSINMAYKNYNNKLEYPWCLQISILLQTTNLNSEGLPDDEESKTANQIEDTLLVGIQKITISQYLGHLFNDGFLDVYIYLNNPKEAAQYLQAQIDKSELVRKIDFQIKRDAHWQIVNDFFNAR